MCGVTGHAFPYAISVLGLWFPASIYIAGDIFKVYADIYEVHDGSIWGHIWSIRPQHYVCKSVVNVLEALTSTLRSCADNAGIFKAGACFQEHVCQREVRWYHGHSDQQPPHSDAQQQDYHVCGWQLPVGSSGCLKEQQRLKFASDAHTFAYHVQWWSIKARLNAGCIIWFDTPKYRSWGYYSMYWGTQTRLNPRQVV